MNDRSSEGETVEDGTVRLSGSNRTPAEDRATGQGGTDLTQKPATAGAPVLVIVRRSCCFSLITMAFFLVAHCDGFQLVAVKSSSLAFSALFVCVLQIETALPATRWAILAKGFPFFARP